MPAQSSQPHKQPCLSFSVLSLARVCACVRTYVCACVYACVCVLARFVSPRVLPPFSPTQTHTHSLSLAVPFFIIKLQLDALDNNNNNNNKKYTTCGISLAHYILESLSLLALLSSISSVATRSLKRWRSANGGRCAGSCAMHCRHTCRNHSGTSSAQPRTQRSAVERDGVCVGVRVNAYYRQTDTHTHVPHSLTHSLTLTHTHPNDRKDNVAFPAKPHASVQSSLEQVPREKQRSALNMQNHWLKFVHDSSRGFLECW